MELLELLKSIHSKGGVFEVFGIDLKFSHVEDFTYPKTFGFKGDNVTYKIPSPQYVEERIVEMLEGLPDKIMMMVRWSFDVNKRLHFYAISSIKPCLSKHPDRLMASLMLWDKLLEERR